MNDFPQPSKEQGNCRGRVGIALGFGAEGAETTEGVGVDRELERSPSSTSNVCFRFVPVVLVISTSLALRDPVSRDLFFFLWVMIIGGFVSVGPEGEFSLSGVLPRSGVLLLLRL